MSKSKLNQADFKNMALAVLNALQKSGNMTNEKYIDVMAMIQVGPEANKAQVLAQKKIVQALLGASSPLQEDGLKKLSTQINQLLKQVKALDNESRQKLDDSKPVLNAERPKSNPLKPK